jgi:transposase
LTDHEWRLIAPHLPAERGRPGRPALANRTVLDGIFWIIGSEAPWEALPPTFGRWNSIYKRYRRWSEAGVFARLLAKLGEALPHERAQLLERAVERARPRRPPAPLPVLR